MSDDQDDEITPLKRTRRKLSPNKKTLKKSPKKSSKTNRNLNINSPKRSSISKIYPKKVNSLTTNKLSDTPKAKQKLFCSTNNTSTFFNHTSSLFNNTNETKLCPICCIDLKFLHGQSAKTHVNCCLDADPKFEQGACTGGTSCLLSDVEHFRQFKHTPKQTSSDVKEVTPLNHAPTETPLDAKENVSLTHDPKQTSIEVREEVPTINGAPKKASIDVIEASLEEPISPIRNVKITTTNDTKIKEGTSLLQTLVTNYFTSVKPRDDCLKTPVNTEKMAIAEKTPIVKRKAERKPKNARKPCPFYKKIPDTSITVDAFSYGQIPGYPCHFLTHFHSDHYKGLSRTFHATVYCSKITGNLVQVRLGVKKVVVLPLNETVLVAGVHVTLFDANHCPGSVIILFELPSGRRILHTGDFRLDEAMLQNRRLSPLDELYLDTTYCDAKHTFPSQRDVVDFVVRTASEHLAKNKKTLLVCGTYTIGKERVFETLAEHFDMKIGVSADKMKILKCLQNEELERRLTCDFEEAQLHVLSIFLMNYKKLTSHLEKHSDYEHLLAFKPTGWSYDKSSKIDDITPLTDGKITTFDVPYSEHSSFDELEKFVRHIRPMKIVPTVGVEKQKTRDKMAEFFKNWLHSD